VVIGHGQKPPPKKDDADKGDKKDKKDNKNNKNNKDNKDSENDKEDQVNVRPDRATVVVSLPADAKLYVDDTFCPLTSEKRSFRTPRLEAGRNYYYTLRVEMVREGKAVKKSRRVYVAAGKKVKVDFRETSTVSTAKKR
jgi:uncharacterized protein (TIGR03000 family)